jgi:hypothetical protein
MTNPVVGQPLLVTSANLVSGNVVSVPTTRDQHGNPTAYEAKALLFAEHEYEDDQAHKPIGKLYFDDGSIVTDPYPEIPKWNVLENGIPFEAIYSDPKKSDGQLVGYRRGDGHGSDIPDPKKPKRNDGGPGKP